MRADGQEDSEPVQVKGLYSRRDDSQHFEGVAIILKKGLEKSMIEWKPVNNRLIKIRLKGRQINTTIKQSYAPTNNNN